jgi:acetylornithine/succinyldiaminopimelate/putrescine aminotransferase
LNGVLAPGTHGTTFGGNPLAASAAMAVIETIEQDGLLAQTQTLGLKLSQLLLKLCEKFPHLLDTERGQGLLRGLVFKPNVDIRNVLAAAREQGVLCSVAGSHVLRITPPFVISETLGEEGVDKIAKALSLLPT